MSRSAYIIIQRSIKWPRELIRLCSPFLCPSFPHDADQKYLIPNKNWSWPKCVIASSGDILWNPVPYQTSHWCSGLCLISYKPEKDYTSCLVSCVRWLCIKYSKQTQRFDLQATNRTDQCCPINWLITPVQIALCYLKLTARSHGTKEARTRRRVHDGSTTVTLAQRWPVVLHSFRFFSWKWVAAVWQMKWNESGFRPPSCTYRLNWARRTSEDGEMIEMTLSSRHRIRNSSPGGLRPSTLPLGHGGSPQYWLSHAEREETFFVSFKPPRQGTEPRTLAWKAAVLTTTLGPPPSCCVAYNRGTWDLSKILHRAEKTILGRQ